MRPRVAEKASKPTIHAVRQVVCPGGFLGAAHDVFQYQMGKGPLGKPEIHEKTPISQP